MLEEEETYEPPEDPDSGASLGWLAQQAQVHAHDIDTGLSLSNAGRSLEELGMRALANIPRDRAIDGIHAFNQLR